MAPALVALRRALVLAVLASLTLALTASLAVAQTGDGSDQDGETASRTVEILPLRSGFIDPPVTAQIVDIIEIAEENGSELVVLQYTSPGGVSVDLDEVLATMEASPVPIAVLVGPLGTGAEAAGAAGMLWLAADVRAVADDAVIGPLEPADLADDGSYPTADRVASLVEATDADPAVVEALLEGPVPAQQLVDAELATLTSANIEPLLVDLDGTSVDVGPDADARELTLRFDEVEVRFHSLGLVRRVLHAATTAPFIYLLLVVGLGMLLFEVFQPGFGVAGLAGVITAAIGAFGLTVLPVTWWAVALVVLGLLLYAVDTAMAGFGPLTVAATAAFAVGSWAFYDHEALALNGWLVAATTLTAFVFFVFVMTTILRAQAGPEGVSVDDLVGRAGIVRSVLNPEGHVYIDGALWRARWTGETKRAKVGTPVRVHDVDGPVILVEPFEPAQPAGVASGDDEGDEAAGSDARG
jgi:membrane-bound serine protease (ClpP class)